ncbi:hypothetical protein J2W48_001831 [Flavobacterium piscis]|uniref:Uncharacterized protein n=1 Tax=Flavobacterium piscis TaxID=1114874 RepID=A0ABU1Y6N7_9FLAO|nr:hypothetical protein [Flavobacterium piscis]
MLEVYIYSNLELADLDFAEAVLFPNPMYHNFAKK